MLRTFTLMIGLCFASHAQAVKSEGSVYLEVAPLKGSYGQISARAEVPVWASLAAAVMAESLSYDGDRDDHRDRERSMGAEAVYYPDLPVAGHLFVAGGLHYTQMTAGRERRRDTQTWGRIRSDEMIDTWVDEGTYVLSSQTIGYRLNMQKWFTTSLRFTSDQILRKSTKTKDEKLFDQDSPAPRSRQHSRQQISVLMGLVIP